MSPLSIWERPHIGVCYIKVRDTPFTNVRRRERQRRNRSFCSHLNTEFFMWSNTITTSKLPSSVKVWHLTIRQRVTMDSGQRALPDNAWGSLAKALCSPLPAECVRPHLGPGSSSLLSCHDQWWCWKRLKVVGKWIARSSLQTIWNRPSI